jgi:uncharacterized protein (TIGR03000 family)
MSKGRGAWVWRALAVASLSLAAAPAGPGGGDSPAQITVRVPEGAEVWFEGRKTAQEGTTRKFLTPSLAPDRWYTYHLEVHCPGAAGTAVRSQTLTVRAGTWLNLDYSTPAEAKEEPPAPTPPPIALLPDVSPGRKAGTPKAASPAQPQFGHDPSYHWLVGTLDYSRIQEAWLIRYAPSGEEDPHGGCVTLLGLGQMDGFRSGQRVRVEGHLIDGRSEQIRPPYRVESIRPLEQP